MCQFYYIYRMRLVVCYILLLTPVLCHGQSRAMRKASEKYEDGFTMVFYYSTLKMVIPEENEDLRNLIRGIEKIKMLRVNEDTYAIGPKDGEQIVEDLHRDGYEEGLSMRVNGKNTLVYIKEQNGVMQGVFILFAEESSVTMLDLLGEVPIDKLFTLTTEIEALTGNESIINSIRDHQSH